MPLQTSEFREHPITVFYDAASSLPIATDIFWNIEDVVVSIKRTTIPTADNSNHVIKVRSRKGLAGDIAKMHAIMRLARVTAVPTLQLRSIRVVYYGRVFGPEENVGLIVRSLVNAYKPDVIVMMNVVQPLENHYEAFNEVKFSHLSCIRDNVNRCATWILWTGATVNVNVINPTFPETQFIVTKTGFGGCVVNALTGGVAVASGSASGGEVTQA